MQYAQLVLWKQNSKANWHFLGFLAGLWQNISTKNGSLHFGHLGCPSDTIDEMRQCIRPHQNQWRYLNYVTTVNRVHIHRHAGTLAWWWWRNFNLIWWFVVWVQSWQWESWAKIKICILFFLCYYWKASLTQRIAITSKVILSYVFIALIFCNK
jgi:hypothetical protein